MDVKKALEALEKGRDAEEVLEQARREAFELQVATEDFYHALKCGWSPEQTGKRWERLKQAAKKVFGKEAEGKPRQGSTTTYEVYPPQK
jgi:hypothetical protein